MCLQLTKILSLYLMTAIKYLSVLFLCAGLFSCTQKEARLTRQQKTAVKNEVFNTLHDYYATINKKGVLGELDYLDTSKEFYWVAPGFMSALSRDSISAILNVNAKFLRSVNNSWIELDIMPITTEYASYGGKISSVLTDTAGKSITSYFLETGLVVKRNDGWKLLHGQTSLLGTTQ